MLGIKQLSADFFNSHDQIAIIVQKSNDMDTCACACALATLLDNHFQGTKKIFILGVYGKSKFLKEIAKYNGSPNWSQETLVVLSEINNEKQINKHDFSKVKSANGVIIIDHHKESHAELVEALETKNIQVLYDPSQTSVCELFWEAIKDTFPDIPKRIMEILFLGLYSDTKALTSERLTPKTFTNIAELMKKGEFRADDLINTLNQRPVENMLLFADTLKDAVREKGLIFISLNPRNVFKHIPRMMIKGKNGAIRQKTLLTYIPRWVEQYTNVNTIVFVHYSLHDPYDPIKRYVYVVLVKPNPGLEHLLKVQRFRQNRNRWSREMNYTDLTDMLKAYKELFTA